MSILLAAETDLKGYYRTRWAVRRLLAVQGHWPFTTRAAFGHDTDPSKIMRHFATCQLERHPQPYYLAGSMDDGSLLDVGDLMDI